ncbi:MAG: hypothetical protein AAGH64_07715, partial [Planctomycetota bacterium]
DELRRILAHPRRAEGVRTIHALALDAPVLADTALGDRPLATLDALAPDADAPLALAAWATDRAIASARTPPTDTDAAAICRDFRRALVLANHESDRLRDVLIGAHNLAHAWSGLRVALRKRWGASDWFDGACSILAARAPAETARIRGDVAALARTPGGLAPAPVITGDDLVAAGYRPGPEFGIWLEDAYNAQLEGRLATREEALARIAGLASEKS